MIAPTSQRQRWKSHSIREDCRQAYRYVAATSVFRLGLLTSLLFQGTHVQKSKLRKVGERGRTKYRTNEFVTILMKLLLKFSVILVLVLIITCPLVCIFYLDHCNPFLHPCFGISTWVNSHDHSRNMCLCTTQSLMLCTESAGIC